MQGGRRFACCAIVAALLGASGDQPDAPRRIQAERVFLGHRDNVQSVVFSPDSRYIVSGGFDGIVRLWSVETGKEAARVEGPRKWIWGVGYSGDGKYIATGGEDGVFVFDAAARKLRHHLNHRGEIHDLHFTSDGKQLMSAGGGAIRFWDLSNGKQLRRIYGDIETASLSPDGTLVASGGFTLDAGEIYLRIWDAATGKEVRRVVAEKSLGGPNGLAQTAFSPDGKLLLATNTYRKVIRVWEVATGRELRSFKGPTDGAVFTRDGGRILSGSSSDQTIRLLDIESGKAIVEFTGHKNRIGRVAVSPNRRWAASCSPDETVRLWRLPK